MEVRTLRFEQVGSLTVEDPVRLNGTLVGSIRDFNHDENGRVLVNVHSRKPIPIRTSSRVAVQVKGVMGERFIEIGLGNPNDPLIPDGQIIDGLFDMGPSEAVVYIDLLEDKLIELKNIMILLSLGSENQRSFIDVFTDVTTMLDTLALALNTGLIDIEDGLAAGLDSAAALAAKTIEFTTNISARAPEILDDLSTLTAKIDNLIPKIETFMAQVDAITRRVDGNEFLWSDDLDKLRTFLDMLNLLMNEVRDYKLSIPIKLKVF
jgi:ABC-type transporter Mla subunit MlaD